MGVIESSVRVRLADDQTDEQDLMAALDAARADAVKYRSSAPGTQLADGTVLVGGGIAQLAAAALADIGAAGGTQVGYVNAAGTTQAAAVAAAGTAAAATMNGLVAQAQTYRDDAQNAAAQATFNGYKGQHGTKAALNGASGKLDGYHVVLADETNQGVPWAYPVAGGAVAGAGFGVTLLNASLGLDLLGPLSLGWPSAGITQRTRLSAADTAAGYPDWTHTYGRFTTGTGGTPNHVYAFGPNSQQGPNEGYPAGLSPFFQTVLENDWRPGDVRWYEWYLQARGRGFAGIVRPLGIVFNKTTNRGEGFSVAADSYVLTRGDGNQDLAGRVLSFYGATWDVGTGVAWQLNGDGVLLRQLSADGTYGANLVGLEAATEAGYEARPIFVARYASAQTAIRFYSNQGPVFYNPSSAPPAFSMWGGARSEHAWPFSLAGDRQGHLLALSDYGVYGSPQDSGVGIGFGVKDAEMRLVGLSKHQAFHLGFGSYAAYREALSFRPKDGGTLEIRGESDTSGPGAHVLRGEDGVTYRARIAAGGSGWSIVAI